MFDTEGIEIYLKPPGDNKHVYYGELEDIEKQTADAKLKKRHFSGGRHFEIVIRFDQKFDMYSANCMQVAIAFGKGQNMESSSPSRRIIQRTWIQGQQHIHRRLHGEPYTVQASSDYSSALPKFDTENDLDYRANPGTVTVFLRRGNVKWQDGDTGLNGPGDHSVHRKAIAKSFKHLGGKNGKTYIFEFYPRSKDGMLEYAKSLGKLKGSQHSLLFKQIQENYGVQPDNDFAEGLRKTKEIRDMMAKDWERLQGMMASTQWDIPEESAEPVPEPKGTHDGTIGHSGSVGVDRCCGDDQDDDEALPMPKTAPDDNVVACASLTKNLPTESMLNSSMSTATTDGSLLGAANANPSLTVPSRGVISEVIAEKKLSLSIPADPTTGNLLNATNGSPTSILPSAGVNSNVPAESMLTSTMPALTTPNATRTSSMQPSEDSVLSTGRKRKFLDGDDQTPASTPSLPQLSYDDDDEEMVDLKIKDLGLRREDAALEGRQVALERQEVAREREMLQLRVQLRESQRNKARSAPVTPVKTNTMF